LHDGLSSHVGERTARKNLEGNKEGEQNLWAADQFEICGTSTATTDRKQPKMKNKEESEGKGPQARQKEAAHREKRIEGYKEGGEPTQ